MMTGPSLGKSARVSLSAGTPVLRLSSSRDRRHPPRAVPVHDFQPSIAAGRVDGLLNYYIARYGKSNIAVCWIWLVVFIARRQALPESRLERSDAGAGLDQH